MGELVRLQVDNGRIQGLYARLLKLGDEKFDAIIELLAQTAGAAAEQYEIIYPPQREPMPEKPRFSKKTGKQLKPRKRTRYKRTGVLGGSLTSNAEREALGVWIAKIGTNVIYAPYVVGMPDDDPGQAWFHQNYWTPLLTELTAHLPEITEVVQERLIMLVKALLD